jgi:hypothetical protein
MTARDPDLAGCVTQYAARLQATTGPGHQVSSPLGAWLLLALIAPASSGTDRQRLAAILGCDPELARQRAGELLAAPHPAIGSAAALWTAGRARNDPHVQEWQRDLPAEVSRGPLPGQAELDAWAREHTFGLIDRFPVEVTPDVVLILATALATKVSWQTPFGLAPASALGEGSPWAGRLHQVLATPRSGGGHQMLIAVTPEAGDVAVHVATAREGVAVVSVAADPALPAARVLAAAHGIGVALAHGGDVTRRELAELPPADTPLWRVLEETGPGGPGFRAVLPAWSARSRHDLSAAGLGFDIAGPALVPGPWLAAQTAMARYSRTGFEAAAVSAAVALAAMPRPQPHRIAELRFAHPYAVVALAVATAGNGAAGGWSGLPLFAAWVADPQDAAHDDDVPDVSA